MKRCCTVIVFGFLLMGCDTEVRRGGIVGPQIPGPPPPQGAYTLSGRIVDVDGAGVPGATVGLAGQTAALTTTTDESGGYQFKNVGGFFVLRVTKADYTDVIANIWIEANRAVTLTLERMLVLSLDVPVRGTIHSPPCDSNWDARALCERVYFTPPETGVYELDLKFSASAEIDVLVDGSYYLTINEESGRIRGTIPGRVGFQSEIRIHSYYSPQAFELTATRATP